ncbi:cupredoxin domain-containing protein [Halioxenophilus sp. WMMB6]|uniref:cupredoxin domain-containing protein n=1 Tax=Halioxenophilus sp. WMMB6 TaxID=3073815 RepID=UPI00295E5097|nr:cupredoxin domain-containing protein [Halioxenophilus sp. WMMB6]
MIWINIAGLLLIALIIWWFWLYKPKAVSLSAAETVIVVDNGNYTPARIQLPAGKPVRLRFLRKDPSPCAELVLIPKLNISESLPVDHAKSINLPALAPGDYPFHCQMQMYRGEIVVE